MKSFRLLTLCALVALWSSQAAAQEWIFAGERVNTDTGTINKHPTKYGYVWIRRDKDRNKNKKLYKMAAKEVYKSIDVTFKSSKSYRFVAIYRIQHMAGQWKGSRKKKVSYYKFYAGKDEASIEKRVAADGELYKYVGVQLVELIDLTEKKAELNRQTENPAPGRSIQ